MSGVRPGMHELRVPARASAWDRWLTSVSAALNVVFAGWLIIGLAASAEPASPERWGWPFVTLVAAVLAMAIGATVAAIGVRRNWDGSLVAIFAIPPLVWLGFLAFGAVVMAIGAAA
jgi:hypothetical protein